MSLSFYFDSATSADTIYDFPKDFTASHYWISSGPDFYNDNTTVWINYATPNQNDKCLLTIIANASNYVNFDSYNEDIAITAYNGEPRPTFDTIYQQKISSSEEMIILSQKDQVTIYAAYTNKYSPPSPDSYDGVESRIIYAVSCRVLEDYSYADFQEEMVEIISQNMIVNPSILSDALKNQLKPRATPSSEPSAESGFSPSPRALASPNRTPTPVPTYSPRLSPAPPDSDEWNNNFKTTLISGKKDKNDSFNILKIIGIILVGLSLIVIIARQIYVFWLKRRNELDDI